MVREHLVTVEYVTATSLGSSPDLWAGLPSTSSSCTLPAAWPAYFVYGP